MLCVTLNQTLGLDSPLPPLFLPSSKQSSKTFKWVKLIGRFIRTWLPLHPTRCMHYEARRISKSDIGSLTKSKIIVMYNEAKQTDEYQCHPHPITQDPCCCST